jgi:Ca2+-binding RTX toxin-like protein
VSRQVRAIVAAVLLATAAPATASATTYRVGPTETYTQPSQVAGLLNPGDQVLIDGGSTYGSVTFSRAGTAAQPITIRGVPVSGQPPKLSGGTNTVELAGDHYLVDGLEITGGTSRCLYHHADDITVRSTVVHDCPANGILSADTGSGSLTLQYVEVYHCGNGTQQHQIYVATDEVAHPGSVFRMEHSYVHDSNGGNSVKSRAERNEIYYNWIEGGTYHELELVGPDPAGGASEDQAREDSDVVGNVLYKRNTFYVARVGGDGTGQSKGRYRFAFNTIITQPGGSAVFRMFDSLDSIEMHGNVLYSAGGGTVNVSRDTEAVWAGGSRAVAGQGNWVETGATNIPAEWSAGITGADPGFTNFAGLDLRPTATSPLVDHGPVSSAGASGHPFPSPLATPAFHPPRHAVEPAGSAEARPQDARIDMGAFEYAPPDSDGDGIPDTSDACPTQSDAAAPRNPRDGCPAAVSPSDADGDGIPDSSDACPTTSDLAAPRNPRTGCPAAAPPGPTAGNDTLNGNNLPNVICGLLGNDTLNGLGGNDTLWGDACNDKTKSVYVDAAAKDGNDILNGGDGNDSLYGAGGNDALNGGKGNDKLFGGGGNDKLNGGPGTNTYSGGSGNDTVNARNGKKETVDCGSGKKDTATVDRKDKTKGCEKVKRAKK